MPTIVDAFLVSFGLDPKEYLKGQRQVDDARKKNEEAENKASKEEAARAKKTVDSITKVRDQVVGLFAVFTAGKGLKDFISDLTNSDAALGRTANNIGVSTGQLSAWQGVAERAGGSAAGITGSMQGLSQQFQQLALTGQSSVVPYFRAVGVTLADASGKMRPLSDILLDLSDRLKGMDPSKAQALGRGMGIDEGTVNVLMQGRTAIAGLLAEQEKLGHANEADAAGAQQRLAAFRGLVQVSTDLGRKLLTELTPAIMGMTKALTGFSEWAESHPTAVKAAFAAITLVVGVLSTALAIGLAGSAVAAVIAGFGTIGTALSVLSGAFVALGAIVMSPFALIVAGVATAGVAAYELYKHWDSVKALFSSIGDKALAMWDVITGKKHGGPTAPVTAAAVAATLVPVQAATQAVTSGLRQPRGIRNFNPGNLNFAGQAGATRETGPGGRFAVFRTMEEGIHALSRQLQIYGSRGNDTIKGIISMYAPANENNTKNYIQSVVKKLGSGAEEHLNLKDPAVLKAMISAITTMEVGSHKISESQINAGLALDPSIRAGAGMALSNSATTNNRNSNSNTSNQASIGTIVINTKATDSKGIAQTIGQALNQNTWIGQANYGLSG